MEKDAGKIFVELKEDITTYAGLKLRFLKLTAIERAARLMAVLSHGIILMLLVFFTVLFLFIALGFYLGELLDDTSLGFLIVGGIYLLLTFIAIGVRGRIREKLMNMMIEAIMANDDDDDTKDKSTDTVGKDSAREEGNQTGMPGKREQD